MFSPHMIKMYLDHISHALFNKKKTRHETSTQKYIFLKSNFLFRFWWQGIFAHLIFLLFTVDAYNSLRKNKMVVMSCCLWFFLHNLSWFTKTHGQILGELNKAHWMKTKRDTDFLKSHRGEHKWWPTYQEMSTSQEEVGVETVLKKRTRKELNGGVHRRSVEGGYGPPVLQLNPSSASEERRKGAKSSPCQVPPFLLSWDRHGGACLKLLAGYSLRYIFSANERLRRQMMNTGFNCGPVPRHPVNPRWSCFIFLGLGRASC